MGVGDPNGLRGVAAAPGIARGPWLLVRPRSAPRGGIVAAAAVDAEVDRLRAAADDAATELMALSHQVAAAGHTQEADIFAAQATMAWDPALIDGAAARIREHHEDAVAALLTTADGIAAMLAALDDELIRARAADVVDVSDRIARRLAGLPAGEVTLDAPAILVAADLSPSLTATLPRDRILGIALEGGSPTAHAAILSRAYGIPAVVAVPGLLATLGAAGPAVELALDGATGEVIVDPDAGTIAELDRRASVVQAERAAALEEAELPAVTIDGVTVALLANIGSPEEAPGARALGARGVGLFRTEFLFLERSTPPSEQEQADAYRRAVEAFGGDPVTIRLLDIGGDKPIPYLPIPEEDNPFLGMRALRLAAERPGLFVDQLRACYRAAVAGPVKVMAPMVADWTDAELLLRLAAEARSQLVAEGASIGDVHLGVMLEIPSAVLGGGAWFGEIAFASLGTNDLTQYTLAVDRGNAALERYRDSLHPAVLRLIALAVEHAAAAGIELSVCGEMGGEPVAALALVGLGVRSLSMSATSLAAVRRAIRGASAADLATLARAALDDRTAGEVRARFADQLPSA